MKHALYSALISVLFVFSVSLGGKLLASDFPIEVIRYQGSPNEFFNLVILGDGYTADEQKKFVQDARKVAADFLVQEPFATMKDHINVYAVKVVSNETGASMHPSGNIDNYFGSSYWSFNIERLLYSWHTDKIATVLQSNTPFYDLGAVMVNHPKYGGSGGEFAVFSTHEAASDIFIHELGHAFSGLSDEYWAGPEFARENTNMTRDNNLTSVRWKEFLGQDGIGIYSHEEAPQWYRPHQSCKMRRLTNAFCMVCNNKITKDIEFLGGSDTLGLPIAFFGSSDTDIPVGSQVAFYDLSSYRPESWSWTFEDGEPEQSTEQNPVVTYSEAGRYSVTLTVTNEIGQSNYIRKEYITVAGPVSAPGITPEPFLNLYPNPVTDYLMAEYDPIIDQAQFRIVNALGEQVLQGEITGKIYVGNLPPGIYIMQISTPQNHLNHKFIKNPQ